MVHLRDGMWLPAKGINASYAESIYEAAYDKEQGAIELLCPAKPIKSRGDTLNQPTLTIKIKAEMAGVISIESTHFSGSRITGPSFDIFPHGKPPLASKILQKDNGQLTLTSGSLSATTQVDHEKFDIQFHATAQEKEIVTTLGSRSAGFAYTPAPSSLMDLADLRDTKHFMFLQTSLAVGESIHGLGERFGAWNKVGQHIELWNADGGTSSEQAYKNVSFFLSNRGYGVFVDSTSRIDMEIGSENCKRVQTLVEGQRLKLYIIYGPTPKEVLFKYCTLTGKPSNIPSWSFGLWLTTSFTTDYDEATVASFLQGMKDRGSPVEVFHYDCFWMKAFTWTDFVFDSERFPDPKAAISSLKEKGLCKQVSVWVNPYIAQHGAAFRHAAENGYLLMRANGTDVWQWDLWQAGMGILDVTNPSAVEWYTECLNSLFDKGVDSIKTDFGERIPTQDVQWHDKAVDPHKMHNYYAYLYNQIVYSALEKRFGQGRAVLFARSACAGSQRMPLQWGGDCESTPEAMAESIRGGLSLGLSGFSFWSCDIGGFEGTPEPWIYKRWVAFGLLCSHSRLHGSNSYRVPWLVDGDDADDEGCSRTLAKWTLLKTRLMPYLYSQAIESVQLGLPLSLRAVALEFPDDPTAWFLDRQFMIGSQLLAAPIFNEAGEVEFYLPCGTWTSLFTNEQKVGPGWFKETHAGFGTLPLYVRENTILVLGGASQASNGPVYSYAQDIQVCLYHAKTGTRTRLVASDGTLISELVTGADGQVDGLDAFSGVATICHNSCDLGAATNVLA